MLFCTQTYIDKSSKNNVTKLGMPLYVKNENGGKIYKLLPHALWSKSKFQRLIVKKL